MSGIESVSTPEREQDVLKQRMLNGEVAPEEVFTKLLEFDQSTPNRRQAFANYESLTNQ